jgi:hypothetical protein
MAEFLESFVPQLLATLVGAGIGVVGIFIAFSLQRKASVADGLDRAVEHLLVCLADYAAALNAYAAQVQMTNWAIGSRPTSHPAHPGRVSIALSMLKLKAPDLKQETVGDFSKTWDAIANGANREAATGIFADVVVEWHAGVSSHEIATRLERVARMAVVEPPG